MDSVYLSFVINLLLLGLLIWEKIRFDGRERDLLNRLMSRDFAEYVGGQTRLQAKGIADDGRVSIEEAADALAEEGLLADQERSPAAVVRVS